MAIFDHFTAKDPSESGKKVPRPTPYRRVFSELDASGEELKAEDPDGSRTVDSFIRVLKEECRARYKEATNGEMRPMRAEARFFLAEDRMRAYACLLRPENGGEEITLDEFQGDMRYEGINYGILQEDIEREFEKGYFRVFLVARGKPPLPGEDGKVTELLQRRKNATLEVQNGSQVDFGQNAELQPIRKGTVICLIRAPRAGSDGMDVTGQRLPSPPVNFIRVPRGENTDISRGGQALTASVDGILYIEDDNFCIHRQKIIDGDLDQFHGTLRVSGNLYIGGNVDGGVEVEASGEIVINGKMGQARVTSTGGTIRVQKGVFGTEGETFLSAAYQVQSPVIEWAEVSSGTSVIAETISNSAVRCGGSVYVMSGRGMIVDSVIRAEDSILCQRVGNLAGGSCRFSVGYPPSIPEAWERTRTELDEVKDTLEKLWGSITTLRRKGNRVTEVEKAWLEQLLEQREFYFKKQENLMVDLKNLNKLLEKKSKGKIECEKVFPVLSVQIGKLMEDVVETQEDCCIHVEGGRLSFKKGPAGSV